MNIAAVVILYNPENLVWENIISYINQIDMLYAIDNSEIQNELLIKKIKKNKKIIYINNKGNKGIAYALNIAAEMALKNKYDFLLTMDQDSTVSEKMIPLVLECINKTNNYALGILSPFHASNYNKLSKEYGCVLKNVVMTSGNFLSLKAYAEVGPFREDLFLDYVDSEYCFRLIKCGYKIIQVSEAILFHNLGELSLHTLFGKNIYCYNYPPVRYYYRTRNVIAVQNNLDVFFGREILKDMIKIFLYEKNMLKKFLYIFFGVKDAIKGKMGKYDR